ncbi:MAG: hypothetical protein IJ680_01720 [Paludibacteraceae bacterium]|nr:hypothetical protein [Paludibacteraceae bacterium]
MRKSKYLLCIIAGLMSRVLVSGQVDVVSGLGVWAEVGYTGMTANVGFNRAPGETGGGGLSYELQAGHYLLEVGAGFLFQNVGTWERSMSSEPFKVGTDDTYYKYTLTGRYDQSRQGYIRFPVLMGACFEHFYFLVGGKVNIALFGNTRSRADVTARTCDIAGTVHDDLWTKQVVRKGPRYDCGIDADASLEAGLLIPLKGKRVHFGRASVHNGMHLRLGVYLDYGLLNLHRGHTSDLPYYAFNTSVAPSAVPNTDDVVLTHIFRSEHANGQNVHNVFGGVRLTFVFPTQ